MPKLTRRVIDSLPTRDTAYISWDTEVRSFGVRVYPSGQKSYLISYRTIPGRRGSKKSYVLGATMVLSLDQARDLARQWLAAIRQGADPAAQKEALRQAPTVAELAERYLTEYAEPKKKYGSLRMDRINVRLHVLPALGQRLVQSITPADIATHQAKLEGVRLHDLRHTYASMGAALGLSLPILGKLLGHQQAATTQRYAHLAPDPVHEAAHRVGARLREALGG
jgi:hypothetical protein